MTGEDFLSRRTVVSGSWLTASQQGRGLGCEMRAALLLFAFDELGAELAETNALEWNTASLAISARLGYREVGQRTTESRPGIIETQIDLRVARGEFSRPDWKIGVVGAEAARHELLGSGMARDH